jgi:hypothetical protein
MRGLGVAGLAGVAACTVPNPAWLLTESEGSSAGGSSAAAEATAGASETGATDATSVGGTTTEGTSTTAVTSGGTVPATSEPATSTSGPDMTTSEPGTTGVDACVFPVAPDIGLTMTTDGPVVCDPQAPRTALVEVLGKAAENQWKFNVCASEDACVLENATCAPGEHIIFTFTGPQELMPTFAPGDCHEVVLLPRAPIDDDAKSCSLRLLRFGHTRYTPYANHYVGAVAVPGTQGLPGNVDWLKVLGFEVVAKSSKPCADDPMNCMPPAGGYDFLVKWDNMAEHTVAEGESFAEQFSVSDDGLQVAIEGAFTDVRSRIELGECLDARDDFRWVWLAALPGP